MEPIETAAKNVEDALKEASLQLGAPVEEIEYEVLEKGSSGFLGIGSKSARIRAWKIETETQNTPEEIILAFLSEVFAAMNMDVAVDVTVSEEEKTADVQLSGEEMGILIGKRGQTIDSLQYLVSLALNKKTDTYYRVRMDMGDYRRRRKETLENLAKNVAYKVKRTRRPVALEPMNPNERRIIHTVLQTDRYVTTYSEGEEPYRHVVVTLKK